MSTHVNIANFNVADHNHVVNFGRCEPDGKQYIDRYTKGMIDMTSIVNHFMVNIVFLSEVTPEYKNLLFGAIGSLEYENDDNKYIKAFYDEKKHLATLFFRKYAGNSLKINDVVEPVIIEPIKRSKEEVDRLQFFNVNSTLSDNSEKLFTVINIHGYGDPVTRSKFLNNDFLFIQRLIESKTIHPDIILCGDFNSTLIDIDNALNDKNMLVSFKDDKPTSFHRLVMDVKNGQFFEKPRKDWFTKMDHIVYSQNFIGFSNLYTIPEHFGYDQNVGYPYDCYQNNDGWSSDHALCVYTGFIYNQKNNL